MKDYMQTTFYNKQELFQRFLKKIRDEKRESFSSVLRELMELYTKHGENLFKMVKGDGETKYEAGEIDMERKLLEHSEKRAV